jgi:biopolymer transport protein ExbD
MKVRRFNSKPPRVEMLPLIDIVFLLLVVFIYTMLSMAVHKGMPVTLPSGEQVESPKPSTVTVTITADGAVFVDQQAASLETLSDMLRRKSDGDTETGVLLFADRALAYDRLFKVMDRIRQAGLHRISLQAESEK